MKLCGFDVGLNQPFFLIAGPCVIENESMTMSVAEQLKETTSSLGINFIFKSSFDKANRSSNNTFRGHGIEEGLRILEKVKKEFDLPVLTDVHTEDQVKSVAEVVDVVAEAVRGGVLVEAGAVGHDDRPTSRKEPASRKSGV